MALTTLPSIQGTMQLRNIEGLVHSHAITHSSSKRFGMHRGVAPVTQSLGYQFLIDRDPLPVIDAWISERELGLSHIDMRVVATEPLDDLVGQRVMAFVVGYDKHGDQIAIDQIGTFDVTHVTDKGNQIYSVEGLSYFTPRPPLTMSPPAILSSSVTTSGQKTVRFPAVWGVSVGDIIQTDEGPITVKRSTMTIRRNYRVVDVTGT